MEAGQAGRQHGGLTLDAVIERVCAAVGIRADALTGGSRRADVSRARPGVAYLWLEWLGHPGPAAAQRLGIRPQTIYQVAKRGRAAAREWQRVLAADPET